MAIYERWLRKKVLITARTYPVPSRKSIEVSCTAGIADDGNWIRLFPVPYRFLAPDKRFTKYQYIEADVTKSQSDSRLESYKINIDSIKILSQPIKTIDKWGERKAKILPLESRSLCFLQAERDKNKVPTLGFFKPKTITSLKIDPATNSSWTADELASLLQYPLFGNTPPMQLEKLPYNFSYEFCCDEPNCPTHTLMCTDWEIGASYRAWRVKYGNQWRTKFEDRYETDMILAKDTYFFVGTIHNHPDAWIIIGLFYPPK
ncbi:MAG: hypothetical protein Q8P44_06045 [Dehalococcoidia bacterium]|nr:hypothetical protein [Dehalococcoidia bacterium]